MLIAEAFLEAGVKIMQFRHKGAYTRDRYAEAAMIQRTSNRSRLVKVFHCQCERFSLLRQVNVSSQFILVRCRI